MQKTIHTVQKHLNSYYFDSPKSVIIKGIKFKIFPKVFNASAASSSKILADNIDTKKGAKVLDMGCGIGLQGIIALYKGASQVTFADINPIAVVNTQFNLKLHALTKRARVIRTNLFQNMGHEKYDTIIFNSPFIYSEKPIKNNPIDQSIFDYRYKTLNNFFSRASDYLNKESYILFVFSSLGNLNKLKNILRKNKLSTEIVFSKKIKDESWWIFKISHY